MSRRYPGAPARLSGRAATYPSPMTDEVEYDVALSFAGEQRPYVDAVAAALRDRGVRVFYDSYEQVNLWGKDLYEHLDYVYQRAARYCVVFASAEYAQKAWTNHERKSAQAKAIQEHTEYILPARFDATEIPGIRGTVGYIDLSTVAPEDLALMIETKLGPRSRTKFFPPVPDLLFEALEAQTTHEETYILDTARQFYASLGRMAVEERTLLFEVFAYGCDSQLPDNVHVSLDLLRRVTGKPPVEIYKTLRGMGSIGLDVTRRVADDHDEDDMIEVRWLEGVQYHDEEQDDYSLEHSTAIARATLRGASGEGCRECALAAVTALDFSALSSVLAATGHRP